MTVNYPHVRTEPDQTLATVAKRFEAVITSMTIDSGEEIRIAPGLDTVTVKTKEFKFNDESLNALATWVGFPKGFLDRLDTDLQSAWMNTMLQRKRSKGVVRVGKKTGIVSVLAPNQMPFEPHLIVAAATKVLGADAPVVELANTPTTFALDVVTNKFDFGDKKIGDITRAGLRFGLNMRQNLAPTVNPYSYRLWCTNGASRVVEGAKIDARGSSIEEVMAELEIKARLAFEMVEADVRAMYDLRNTPVVAPERTLSRMAVEHGLSDRLRLRAIDALPSMVEDMNHVSMFEVIQAVTHLANDPAIHNRGARESLESFGAAEILHHIERCGHCAAKLN